MASYLVVGEEADPLHLVEHRVVTGVNLVPPVNISGHQERVQPGPHQLPLVGGGVSTKHRFPDTFSGFCCWNSFNHRCIVGHVTHLFT